MAFKFSVLSLEKTNECETNQMVKTKRKPTALTKALVKCKGKRGEKWNKCLKDEGINKKSKKRSKK